MQIKEQRELSGITQSKLASMLGVTQSAISQWESGECLPRAEVLPLIAKILGCTIDELLGGQKGEVDGKSQL